jgi:hypothetical protein
VQTAPGFQFSLPRLSATAPRIQSKTSVTSPGDVFEREADEVADKVIRMGERSAIRPSPVAIQHKSGEREEEEETSNPVGSESPGRAGAIGGWGAPLSRETRSFFEPRFGYDFSRVRVHADAEAATLARAEHARAYTLGRNIVFGAGEYAPATTDGKLLLAHELAHVVQQSHGAPAHGTIQRKDDPKSDEGEGSHEGIVPASDNDKSAAAGPAVTVTKLNYAFIFAHDAYGEDAKRYIRTFYPGHLMVEVNSLEGMIDRMWADTNKVSETNRFRIREIIIVSHGNASGGMTSVSLVPGSKVKFSPPDMVKLQQDFQHGLYQRFQSRRSETITRAIDENTHVEIKGCRIGKSEEALEALRSFLGGEATVNAPTTYQGFDTIPVPGPLFKNKDDAYDALLGSHVDLPEKLLCKPGETKSACLDRNFPNGRIPSQFFITSDEDKAKFKALKAAAEKGKMSMSQAEAQAEPLKHRDEDAADSQASLPSALGQPTYDDTRSIKQIEQEASALLAHYRPQQAYMLVALRSAWMRKKLDEPMSSSLDPLEGLPPEGIFGDPNIVGPDASRFPGATGAVDTFTTNVPSDVPEVSEKERAAYAAEETVPALDPGRVANTGAMTMAPDRLSATPEMPRPPLQVELGKQAGKKPDTALVLRGDFTKSFEIKYEKQLGYLKVKKAVVDFNGKIDFRGEGEKELIISAVGALSSKPGETVSGGGDKGEATLAKGKDADTGVEGKVTGGLSIGGQERTKEGAGTPSTRGMKAQFYLGTQVKWGPVAQELKLVVVGIDETKSGTDMWTVLGIDWSPIVVQGDFELPVSDGTKVKFTGTVRLTISAEPDWAKIGLRLAQLTGRQVAAEGAIVAGGATGAGATGAGATGLGTAETAGGATAATGLGEVVMATGFAAGAAVAIYSYFKSIEEIEDLKALQRNADAGVADFCGGYLAQVGIPSGGNPGGGLWKEGQRHAEINLKGRIKRATQFLNEKYQGRYSWAENDPDVRAQVLSGVQQDAASWRKAVYLSYETAIRTVFYRAWQKSEHGSEREDLNARARAGLASVDPEDEPNYDWINAVGSRAATGMQLPKNVR